MVSDGSGTYYTLNLGQAGNNFGIVSATGYDIALRYDTGSIKPDKVNFEVTNCVV